MQEQIYIHVVDLNYLDIILFPLQGTGMILMNKKKLKSEVNNHTESMGNG